MDVAGMSTTHDIAHLFLTVMIAPGIASMVDGRLLPRRPADLARIVCVTLIGPGAIPKEHLRYLFRVRRAELRAALLWLKQHNPKYYGEINIDEDNLSAYPEDDIPVEVLAAIRQCEDAGVIDQENAGYVASENGAVELLLMTKQQLIIAWCQMWLTAQL
jgi:hypothetical protein